MTRRCVGNEIGPLFLKLKTINYIILPTFPPSTPVLYQASFPLVKMQPPSSAYAVENGPEEGGSGEIDTL